MHACYGQYHCIFHALQVLSQVLVPPLAQQYEIVKASWMKGKRWMNGIFIELLEDGCSDAEAKKLCTAVQEYLDL